jgi:hypothetical protein
VEDAPRSGRPRDQICHERIRETLEEHEIGSARAITSLSGCLPLTLDYVFMEVLELGYRYWRYAIIFPKSPDDQVYLVMTSTLLTRRKLVKSIMRHCVIQSNQGVELLED